MNAFVLQAGTAFIATMMGTGVGFGLNQAAKKATKKAIKPENFTSQEEFEKAYKMRSLRNGLISGAGAIAANAAIGVGASYVICDVIPSMNGDEACDGGDETTTGTDSEMSAFI